MNQRRPREILKQHELWLRSGGKQGERANLINVGLSCVNLVNANLACANLHAANLFGADLSSANLWGANLINADLRSANLRGADLRGANLAGARLHYTNLIGADLIGSSLDTLWMEAARVSDSQLSWLATDPNFPKWVSDLRVEEQ